jgi:hypothetical protein
MTTRRLNRAQRTSSCQIRRRAILLCSNWRSFWTTLDSRYGRSHRARARCGFTREGTTSTPSSIHDSRKTQSTGASVSAEVFSNVPFGQRAMIAWTSICERSLQLQSANSWRQGIVVLSISITVISFVQSTSRTGRKTKSTSNRLGDRYNWYETICTGDTEIIGPSVIAQK